MAETLVWSRGQLVKLKLHIHLLRAGRSVPVVRYDHAHNVLHVHRFHEDRIETWHIPLDEALRRAQRELRDHLEDWILAADRAESVTSDVSHKGRQ